MANITIQVKCEKCIAKSEIVKPTKISIFDKYVWGIFWAICTFGLSLIDFDYDDECLKCYTLVVSPNSAVTITRGEYPIFHLQANTKIDKKLIF